MSVQNEINRISDAKNDIRSAIIAKGVSVPEDAKIDTYAELINNIKQDVGYSLTPIDTGKKWIDGKSVWRKVINFNLDEQQSDIWQTDIQINDTVETFISATSFINSSQESQDTFLVNGVTTNNSQTNPNTITITAYNVSYSKSSGYAIIEYTRP